MQDGTSETPSLKTLAQVEADTIDSTIKYFNGNLSRAAKSLGIGRATIYRKIKQYGIKVKSL